MSKILITGGLGAIGSSVTKALLEKGHDLTVIDDLSSGNINAPPEGVNWIEGSIENDQDLAAAFAQKPEFVIHLAALFANQNSVEHPQKDLAVNGLGTIKLLETAQKHRVQKLVYSSSSCVYGDRELMQEDDPVGDTATPYAITKLLGEHYCKFWASYHGLDIAIVRIFNTYGPGESPGPYRNVIPNFLQLATQERPLVISGTGEETRDFNYVTDTAAGILAALFSKTTSGDTFNIASGKSTKIIELAQIINKLTGNPAGIKFTDARKWDHVKTRRPSVEKAKRVLNYQPRTFLEEGLEKTIAWFQSHVR
jgi:nucleoside-diphosphate-sugar epimerase